MSLRRSAVIAPCSRHLQSLRSFPGTLVRLRNGRGEQLGLLFLGARRIRSTRLSATDLLSGQVQVMFASVPGAAIEFILTGKLRALGLTTPTRWTALMDIPLLADFVPGYEASGWYGVGAPKNTPAEIIDKLNR